MISCEYATMLLISISIVALNLGQSAGTPLVIYNIRLTGLLTTRTKPQCSCTAAVAVVTWHLPGDWWCHTGCHHSLAQKGRDGGRGVSRQSICVLGRHLVVVAAGSEKTRGVGAGGFSFIKTPLCEPHAKPHPGCKLKLACRAAHTRTFINTRICCTRLFIKVCSISVFVCMWLCFYSADECK